MAGVSVYVGVTERPTLREWSRRFFATPPGWWFHLLCVPPALASLWFASYPDVLFEALLAYAVLVALAIWWLVRLVAHLALRGHRRRWFLIAPVGGVALVVLLNTNAPLQARWHLSEGDFSRVVASLDGTHGLPISEVESRLIWEPVDVPRHIGKYDIIQAERVTGGLIFYVTGGLDDAGFGWFPNGPNPEILNNGSFENPQFTHLHGPWYSWTASW